MMKLFALKPLLSIVLGTAAVTGATYGATELLSNDVEAQEERATPESIKIEEVTYNGAVSPEDEINAILPLSKTEEIKNESEPTEYIEEEAQEEIEVVIENKKSERVEEEVNVAAAETKSNTKSISQETNKVVAPPSSAPKTEQPKKTEIAQQPETKSQPKVEPKKTETKKEEAKEVKKEQKPTNQPKKEPVKEEPVKNNDSKYSDLPDDLRAWFEQKDTEEEEAWEDHQQNSEEICGTCKPSDGTLFD